jgi:hypothetical protein
LPVCHRLANLQALSPSSPSPQEQIMASNQTQNGAPTIDAAFEQVGELNEQVLTAARKAGSLYVDAYEKTVDRPIELELKLAGLTRQQWLKSLLEGQAEFAREIADSYATATRNLLR